jgi:hypothetical protein
MLNPTSEYHKGYHGTTLKNTSYLRTPVAAPIAFFVMRCKKKLKLLPERFLKDSSSRYIKEKAYTTLTGI